MKYTPKTKPFKHQSRATLAALRHRNYALLMEPRCGKSKAALDYCGVLAMKRRGLKVVILCPAAALDVWDSQIEQHYPHFAMCEDRDTEWSYPGNSDYITQFYIMSHELFRARKKNAGNRYTHPNVRLIEEFNPDVVIDDESHRHKRAGGVGAQAMWRMVRRLRKRRAHLSPSEPKPMPWVLLLSGTPNPKGWIDLFAQFRIMDDSIYGTSKSEFEDEYCQYGTGRNKYRITKYLREPTLKKKLRANSITVTAEEAGLAGELFFQNLYCTLPPKVRRSYNELVEEYITELESGTTVEASNPGVKRIRCLQIAGGFTTDGERIHHSKVDTLAGYLHLLYDQGERPVIYARYLPEVAACVEAASKVGYRAEAIHGGISRSNRSKAIAAFQQGQHEKSPMALVLQVQAGSVAIELSAAAECIFYSLPDGWITYKQNYDRLRGPKQKRPVRITHIIARGTVDRSTINHLKRGEDFHGDLYRDPRRYLLGL